MSERKAVANALQSPLMTARIRGRLRSFYFHFALFCLLVSSSDKGPGSARLRRPRTLSVNIAHRGTITTATAMLATSVDAMTIYANPKEIKGRSSAAEAVASALGDADEYAELLKRTRRSSI